MPSTRLPVFASVVPYAKVLSLGMYMAYLKLSLQGSMQITHSLCDLPAPFALQTRLSYLYSKSQAQDVNGA